MNNFQRIIPRKKSNKKRASSSKRSNSLTEGNNPKKINNSERFFTTYDEVFEKLKLKVEEYKDKYANKIKKYKFETTYTH